MTIKECIVKNKFDWWLVYADIENGKVNVILPKGFTNRSYAYATTVNWSRKLNQKMR